MRQDPEPRSSRRSHWPTAKSVVKRRRQPEVVHMLLAGKKLLITGVLTPQSIAFGIAETAQKEGAELVLTSFGRAMSLTERSAKRLDPVPELIELDVTNPAHFAALTDSLRKKWGKVDGAVHAVAYAPEDALGGNFLNTPW